MAESSIFHTTGTSGDGANTYTQEQVWSWVRRTWLTDPTTQGVHRASADYPTPLAVTAASGSVDVAAGAGIVYGCPYENTDTVNVVIPTPAAATRIDRIVLRLSWSAHTVRITRIAGVEGEGAPAITQTASTTWDIKLAQVSITTGGAITVTDERTYLPLFIQDGDITTAMLADGVLSADATGRAKMADGFLSADATGRAKMADGFVNADKIANRTRKFLVPPIPSGAAGGTTPVNNYLGAIFNDNSTEREGFFFIVPSDFVSGLKVAALIGAGTTGDVRVQTKMFVDAINGGDACDDYDVYEVFSITTPGVIYRIGQISLTGSKTVAGAIVSGEFTRWGTHASDTLAGDMWYKGIEVEYVADS